MIKNKMPKMPKIFKHWRKVDNVLLLLAIMIAISCGINHVSAQNKNISIEYVSTINGEYKDGEWTPILMRGLLSEIIYDVSNVGDKDYTVTVSADLYSECSDYVSIYWSYFINNEWEILDKYVVIPAVSEYQFKLTIDVSEDCPNGCTIEYMVGIQ